jgi:hypothetical protein
VNFVYDVTDMEPNLAASERINIAGSKTAHLTSKAVAIKSGGAETGRNAPSEFCVVRLWWWFCQNVLPDL